MFWYKPGFPLSLCSTMQMKTHEEKQRKWGTVKREERVESEQGSTGEHFS